jgi:hypothetical protein
MQTIDWSTIKFRASSWGNLLTEPVTKAAKEAGELSKTCQTELIKIYNQVNYGRRKDITTKQMDKGIIQEPISIDLLCKVDGKLYFKNEEHLENEWFSGHPDCFVGDNIENAEEVIDIKTSWDIFSFMPKLIEEPDKGYVAQLNAYFDLTGAKSGAIAYCLVSSPSNFVEEEIFYLLKRSDAATEYSPNVIDAVKELKSNMIYDDIDYRERVIKIPVQRDDELIAKMKAKVPIMRIWLQNFHEKHMRLYPKL